MCSANRMKNSQVMVKKCMPQYRNLTYSFDVHCGNAKIQALALSECFIIRQETQIGEGRGTEGGWRADGLSSRNSSVLPVLFYDYSSGLTITLPITLPPFCPSLSFLPSVLT